MLTPKRKYENNSKIQTPTFVKSTSIYNNCPSLSISSSTKAWVSELTNFSSPQTILKFSVKHNLSPKKLIVKANILEQKYKEAIKAKMSNYYNTKIKNQ